MDDASPPSAGDAAFLAGGGETGRLIRDHDWSASALGPLPGWPAGLRTSLGLVLRSQVPLVMLWGADGVMLYNDAYSAFAGGRHPGLLGAKVREGWPEVAAFNDHVMRVGMAGGTLRFRDQELTLFRHGRPEQVWMDLDYSPVPGEDGQPAGVLCILAETTQRVGAEQRRLAAEAALREGEERLRAIVETARDYAIFTTDPEGRIETWPAGAQEVFGWAAAEAVGQPVDMTFTPEDRAQGAPDMERSVARTAGQAPNVRWHLRKDGSRVFIEGIMRPLRDEEGDVTGFVKVGQDVTERSATEEALRASEARLGFLDRLGAETAALADADAVLAATTRLLGEHLGVSVCAYADMDEDQDGFTIRGDWAAPGSRSIVGRYRLADFGRLAVGNLTAGLPLVVADNLRELPPEEAATFRAIGVAATICMPLVKEGRLAALMAIHDREPRAWTEAELGLLREVTARSWAHIERVAAAAALRDSEARFRLMADAVPQIVWVTDAEGRAEFFNKQWTSYTGAAFEPATAAEVAANHVHPDDAAATTAAFDDARRTGTTFTVEHRIRSAGGTYRWFLVRAECTRDAATGEAVQWFGASVDIHDRREAEAALRESEARHRFRVELGDALRGLASPSRIMAVVAARVGSHLGVDQANYFLVDGTRFVVTDEWRTAASPGLLGSHDLAGFGAVGVARMQAGQALRLDDTRDAEVSQAWTAAGMAAVLAVPLRRDGAWAAGLHVHQAQPRAWTDAEEALLRDTAESAWAEMERVRAEGALRESEARLRAVIDAAPVGLVFADASGRITDANARVEEIFGSAATGFDGVGRHLDGDVAFHADGRRVGRHEHPLAQVVRGEVERADLEVQVQLPDGSTRWVRTIATPVTDESGRRIGAVAASLDVDRERRLTENLAREVEAAVAEREEAQEQLRQSQKMEAMGQLTGGVAHDFNNLLTPILAVLDRLQRRGVGGEREQRLIDGAAQSAERARTLVQRLLAFARRQPLQPRAVDLAALVRGMAELIASTLGPRIEVGVDLPPDLPPARADAHQLEMALLNLAVNARDAMPDGGRLTLSAAREAVRHPRHPAKLRPGSYLRLSVADTGAGMDEATLARAVEPFFSTKGVGRGTGLGLSMVHGLASQLNGGLAISSRPGQGTTVTLWLPISPARAEDDRSAAGVAGPSLALGTALLVDDEDLVRMSTADMLQDLGYEVVEARSAEEALHLVGEGLAPNLVVTDHLMPGLSGVDLARELRARRPDLPVLIVSGYAEVDGIAPGLPRLAKPFRAAELAASLAALGREGAP